MIQGTDGQLKEKSDYNRKNEQAKCIKTTRKKSAKDKQRQGQSGKRKK
jgi:hypothetical protein